MFGTRRNLLEEAKRRISQNPDNYFHHVYGEYEAGGTSHLYLAAVPFEQLGLRTDIGIKPYPEYSLVYLSAIPFIATITPIAMLAINAATRKNKEKKSEH